MATENPRPQWSRVPVPDAWLVIFTQIAKQMGYEPHDHWKAMLVLAEAHDPERFARLVAALELDTAELAPAPKPRRKR